MTDAFGLFDHCPECGGAGIAPDGTVCPECDGYGTLAITDEGPPDDDDPTLDDDIEDD